MCDACVRQQNERQDSQGLAIVPDRENEMKTKTMTEVMGASRIDAKKAAATGKQKKYSCVIDRSRKVQEQLTVTQQLQQQQQQQQLQQQEVESRSGNN